MTDEQMKTAIKRQKAIMYACGVKKATWELFALTWGWRQMKKGLFQEEQRRYQELWEEEGKVEDSLIS